MKIENSSAAQCRYGQQFVQAFPGADVLWEDAENDYQGAVAVVFRIKDAHFGFYEWVYGSCSGCDDWEARELTDEQIASEMRERAAIFGSKDALLAWLDMTDVSKAYKRPERSIIAPLLEAA